MTGVEDLIFTKSWLRCHIHIRLPLSLQVAAVQVTAFEGIVIVVAGENV